MQACSNARSAFVHAVYRSMAYEEQYRRLLYRVQLAIPQRDVTPFPGVMLRKAGSLHAPG